MDSFSVQRGGKKEEEKKKKKNKKRGGREGKTKKGGGGGSFCGVDSNKNRASRPKYLQIVKKMLNIHPNNETCPSAASICCVPLSYP